MSTNLLTDIHDTLQKECPRIMAMLQQPSFKEVEMPIIRVGDVRIAHKFWDILWEQVDQIKKQWNGRVVSIEWRRFENLDNLGRFVLKVIE